VTERYRVIIRKSVAKDLKGIPRKDVRRILSSINALADEPRPLGTKKLSGQERYRLRQGNYRILYQIEDDRLIVCVVRVGDRRDVYR
jgi:mRNA interferase RelE/StbE